MNIHEYQGKQVFRKFGVVTPRGEPAMSVDEAVAAAQKLGGNVWVVKAQIHAGGRGKGGGVKVAKSIDEVRDLARKILGMTLVTHQTGPQGRVVKRLLIEEGASIAKEYYLAVVVDRVLQRAVMMASSEGGVNIEEVAEKTPELIHKVAIDPFKGLQDADADELARKIGIPANLIPQARELFKGIYRVFDEMDCSLCEVNPLITTNDGRVVALDAKLNFDSNALFRHPDVVELRDLEEEDPAEVEASKYDLNYIQLDGDIGCLVNGAGLAMATMDTIKLFGGNPANFLDVGGGASKEKVTAAFKLILADPAVKAVLVNIFGGIMKCDVIAEGIIAAAKEVQLKVPLVVRLVGTNVEKGKELLRNSGLAITPADNLRQAAEKAVAAVK